MARQSRVARAMSPQTKHENEAARVRHESIKKTKKDVKKENDAKQAGVSWQVRASAEVGRCDHREEVLLRKVREEDATHLVLGTGGAPRFSFR